MAAIALVDDRLDARSTVAGLMRRRLRGTDWEVIDIAPLPNISDYPGWIVDNDVKVIVLDERLNELAQDSEGYANYSGHNVAEYLRGVMPDLPQFIVTTVPDTAELNDAAADLDAIIKREDFSNKSAVFVERMVRAGSSFSERTRHELIVVDEISRAIVSGGVTQQQIDSISALRGKQQLLGAISHASTMIDSAAQLESICQRLEDLMKDLDGMRE